MIQLEQMTDEQFERHTLELLKRELGAYGLARFLNAYRSGYGDYTHDRRKWLDGVSIDQLIEEAGKSETSPSAGR